MTAHAENVKTKNIIACVVTQNAFWKSVRAVRTFLKNNISTVKSNHSPAVFIGGIRVLAFYMDHRTDGSAWPREHEKGESEFCQV